MKRVITTPVRIEHADCFESRCLHLWCQTPAGKYFETAVSFNANASRHSAAYQRFRLVQHLLACHEVDEDEAWRTNLRILTGRFFKFRLNELKPGTWAIDAAKAIEPFPILDPDSEENCAEVERLMKEMGYVR